MIFSTSFSHLCKRAIYILPKWGCCNLSKGTTTKLFHWLPNSHMCVECDDPVRKYCETVYTAFHDLYIPQYNRIS